MQSQKQREHEPDSSRLPQHVSGWIRCHPGKDEFYDGMVLLTAVPVCNRSDEPDRGWHYEYEVVHVNCDEDYFSLSDANGDGWGWEIDHVDFYIILRN